MILFRKTLRLPHIAGGAFSMEDNFGIPDRAEKRTAGSICLSMHRIGTNTLSVQ